MIKEKHIRQLNHFAMNTNRSHFLDIFSGVVGEEKAETLWRNFSRNNDIVGFYIMQDTRCRKALLAAINEF